MTPQLSQHDVHAFVASEVRHFAEAIAKEPPGPMLDLTPEWKLTACITGRHIFTPEAFHASVEQLPFADGTFRGVMGIHFLDWLDGKAMPRVLDELARVSRMLMFVLAADVLATPDPIMASTLLRDGSYLTQFSRGWWQHAVARWPGWWVEIVSFRVMEGAIVVCGKGQVSDA